MIRSRLKNCVKLTLVTIFLAGCVSVNIDGLRQAGRDAQDAGAASLSSLFDDRGRINADISSASRSVEEAGEARVREAGGEIARVPSPSEFEEYAARRFAEAAAKSSQRARPAVSD